MPSDQETGSKRPRGHKSQPSPKAAQPNQPTVSWKIEKAVGKYWILNVEEGGTVTVHDPALLVGKDFFQKTGKTGPYYTLSPPSTPDYAGLVRLTSVTEGVGGTLIFNPAEPAYPGITEPGTVPAVANVERDQNELDEMTADLLKHVFERLAVSLNDLNAQAESTLAALRGADGRN